ncbi:MAG: hypothetical protein AB8G11_00605 [Saprospiraceae bacterium]
MKLQKYNQWILAIAGTVGLLFLVGVVLFAIIDFFNHRYYDWEEEYVEPISEIGTDELLKDSLRSQIISFDEMLLLDSATKTYLLPITQENLEEVERVSNNGLLGLTNSSSYNSYKIKYDGYQLYNNLVVYNGLNAESKILFKDKVAIIIESILLYDDKKYVFLLVSTKDTNKDKVLDNNDLQDLYVYTVQSEKLQKIEKDDATIILNIRKDVVTNSIIVRYGFDRNKNGAFESTYEPAAYKLFDIETMTMKNIVPSNQINELQKILQGN